MVKGKYCYLIFSWHDYDGSLTISSCLLLLWFINLPDFSLVARKILLLLIVIEETVVNHLKKSRANLSFAHLTYFYQSREGDDSCAVTNATRWRLSWSCKNLSNYHGLDSLCRKFAMISFAFVTFHSVRLQPAYDMGRI